MSDPVTNDEIRAKLQEAIEFTEQMTGVELPRTIDEAMTPEWFARVAKVAEGIVEHVSEKELKDGRMRVIPIARANAILRSIENRAVHQFVQSVQSEVCSAICSPFAFAEYLLANEGKILIVLSEIAGSVAQVIRGDFLERSLEQWEIRDKQLSNFEFGQFWAQLAVQNDINEQLVQDVIAATGETIERALSGICWDQIAPIVGAMLSGAVVAKTFKPLLDSRKLALKDISKAPLPQTSKGRWCRRKRSRRA